MSYEDRMRLKAFRNKLPGNEENVAREVPVVREPSPVEEIVVSFKSLFIISFYKKNIYFFYF